MIDVSSLHDRDYHLREVTDDPDAYYLRQGEAPGRWTGRGARLLGLGASVEREALHDAFAGKDPFTGRFLLSARGSSARAREREDERLLDVNAAAARLGVRPRTVRSWLRDGRLQGVKGRYGNWQITPESVDEAMSPRRAPRRHRGDAPRSTGYGLAEAAARIGVDRSYLAQIVTEERPPAETRRAHLLGTRDDNGHWRVTADEVRRFVADRRAPRSVPAYDLAVRAPKSVSLLHALGDLVTRDDLRRVGLGHVASVSREVLAAHHAAVEEAVRFLESHAAFIRGPGGRVRARGLTVAVFDHRGSREGDPLLHSHLVILNFAEGIDGRWAALDGTALYTAAKAAGHVYQARLRRELAERLRLAFAPAHNGLADIAGFPRAVIDFFSIRRRQILALLTRRGLSGPAAAQVATLDSRVAKGRCEHGADPEAVAIRAASLGFGRRELIGLLGRGPGREASPDWWALASADLATEDGLTERATRVDVLDAVCALASRVRDGADASTLEREATRLLRDPRRFVPLLDGRRIIRRRDGVKVRVGRSEPSFTTPELLVAERTVIDAFRAGLGADGTGVSRGVADDDALAAALVARSSLTEEQVAMIRYLCTSGIGVDVVVGRPGAGKTFALGACADAWRRSGWRVIGAALQGGAAETLAMKADLSEQYTLARLVWECETGGLSLRGSVVVVDEAAMAETRLLARLVVQCTEADAKLVLVGDPDQVPEVGAGGTFSHLVELRGEDLVALEGNVRQRDERHDRRLRLLRDGDVEAAIGLAKQDGLWHTAPDADSLRSLLLDHWAMAPGLPGADKLMIATTVAEVETLNRLARAWLLSSQRLGKRGLALILEAPDRAVDVREFRVGDRVRANRNRGRRLRTGRVGTVVAVHQRRVEVEIELDPLTEREKRQPRRMVLTRDYLQERRRVRRDGSVCFDRPGLTHAYAGTANTEQGKTGQRTFNLVEPGTYRQAAYTAWSRSELETHLYALTVPDADEIDRRSAAGPQKPPDPDNHDELARALARDASQTMASVADPSAFDIADLVAQPPEQLAATREQLAASLGGRPPLVESLRIVRTVLHDAYGIPLEELECPQLAAAMMSALQVPGADAERLADLMLSRGHARGGFRELHTAEDPMAVLVWAAGEYARDVLLNDAGRAPVNAEDLEADACLRLVESAQLRRRAGRLALAEAELDGPIPALLGPSPAAAEALIAWRRAAAAVLDYRDAVGLFDHDSGDEDPLRRALGEAPVGPGSRAHLDQVLACVAECRAARLLAAIADHVPPSGPRPSLDVAALARRPLADLRREPDPEGLVALAIAAREAELRREALARPPTWLRRDVDELTATPGLRVPDAVALYAAYGDVAVFADLCGRDADDLDVILAPPDRPELQEEWAALVIRLEEARAAHCLLDRPLAVEF